MKIKAANNIDIKTIQILAASIWPVAYQNILSDEQLKYMLLKFYSESALEEQMLTKGHQFYLALNEHHVAVGFSAVSKENKDTFKLQKLYVLPAEQGKDYGKLLLKEVINYSKLNGGKSLILNVNKHNNAQNFYKKNGFQIIQEIDIPIGNNFFMNDFVMERNL
jgi:ribosomal protein S18 acetylase RimI-like enzyme